MPGSTPRGGAGVAQPTSPSLNAAAPVFVPKQLRASAPAFVPRANASPFHPNMSNFSMPPMPPMPNPHLNPMQFNQSAVSQFPGGVVPLHFASGSPAPAQGNVRASTRPMSAPKRPSPALAPAPAPAPVPVPSTSTTVDSSADNTSFDSTVTSDVAPSAAFIAEETRSCETVSAVEETASVDVVEETASVNVVEEAPVSEAVSVVVEEETAICAAASPAAPVVADTESKQPETVPLSEQQETPLPVPVCEAEKPAQEQPTLPDDNVVVVAESNNIREAAQLSSGGLQEAIAIAASQDIGQTAPDVPLGETLEPIPEGAAIIAPAPEAGAVDEVAGEPVSALDEAKAADKAADTEDALIPADHCYTIDFMRSMQGTFTQMPDDVIASLACFGKGSARQMGRDDRRRGYDRARNGRGYGGGGGASGSQSSGMERSSSFSSGGAFRDRGRHHAARNAAESERDANFSRASFGISAGQIEHHGDRRGGRRDRRDRHRHGRDRSPSPYTGPVAPLKVTENHYRVHKDIEGEAKLLRQMQSILNKLTPEKFDVLVDKLVSLILEHVEFLDSAVQLMFSKAVMEFNFATMYASLCRVLSSRLSNESDARDFRASVLHTCQKAFESRLGADSFDDLPDEEKEDAIAKARRHCKGVVTFMGELYNTRLLRNDVILNCIINLFKGGASAENDVEDGCTLLMVVGKEFDKGHGNKVMLRGLTQAMAGLADPKSSSLSSRVRFMLRDCLDLRAAEWNPRREKAVATTIAEVHKKAAEDARRKEAQAQQGRGRDRRGDRDRDRDRGFAGHRSRSRGAGGGIMNRNTSRSRRPAPSRSQNDGWSTVRKQRSGGGNDGLKPARGSSSMQPSSSLQQQQSSDVRLAGLPPRRAQSSLVGAGSTRRGGGGAARDRVESHKAAADKALRLANGFTALHASDDDDDDEESENVSDVGEDAPSDASAAAEAAEQASASSSGGGAPVDEETLHRSIESLLKEFFHIAELDEAVQCVEELPSNQMHHDIVLSALSIAVDQGASSVERASKLLVRLSSGGHLSGEHFQRGLTEFLEFVPDLAIDIPRIYEFLPMMLCDLMLGDCISLSIFSSSAMTAIREANLCEKIVMPTLRRIRDEKDDSFLLDALHQSGVASQLPELVPSKDLRGVLQRYDLDALLRCL